MENQDKILKRIDSLRKVLASLSQSFTEAEIAVKTANSSLENMFGLVKEKDLEKLLKDLEAEADQVAKKRDRLSLRLEEELDEFKDKIRSDI